MLKRFSLSWRRSPRIAVWPRVPLAAGAALLALGPALFGMGSPPLITDDPGTPDQGHWEINLGFSTERRADERESEAPLLDLNYGLRRDIQLKYEMPFLIAARAGEPRRSAWGDSEVGVKWRFHDTGDEGCLVSVYPQFAFNTPRSPAANRGLVERGSGFLLPIQFEKKLGGVTLNLQAGREFRSGGDTWFYGAALSRELGPRWEIGGELVGTSSPSLARSQLTINGGVMFKLGESVSLMASLGRDLRNPFDSRATMLAYLGCQLRR